MKTSLSLRFAVFAAAATLMLGNTLVSMQVRASMPAPMAAAQALVLAEAQ